MISNSELHHFLITRIVDNGYAPDNITIANHFGTSEAEVVKALYRLQEYHGVVLHPNEPKVWVIHPFSLAPLTFTSLLKKVSGGVIAPGVRLELRLYCKPI